MIDHPVFPFPDPKAYSETISRKNIPLVGNLVAATHFILLERDELKILNEIRGKQVASPWRSSTGAARRSGSGRRPETELQPCKCRHHRRRGLPLVRSATPAMRR